MKIRLNRIIAGLAVLAVALTARPLTITGSIMNGSQANAPVPQNTVILTKYVAGQKVESFQLSTRSDSTGQFTFQVSRADSQTVYIPVTTFAAVEYSGPGISLPTNGKSSDIIVYDTTVSDAHIWVPMHHILLEPGIDQLRVKEIMLFENRGKYTYIGTKLPGEAKPKTVQVTTFPGAVNLEPGGDLMSCCAIPGPDRVFDSMEFPPGTRNIVLTYTIPYENKELTWQDTLLYATGNYDVFVADGPVTMAVNRLNQVGSDSTAQSQVFQIREQKYNRIHLADLNRDDVLSITMTNLPRQPADIKYLAPVLLALAIIGITYWNRKGHQPQT